MYNKQICERFFLGFLSVFRFGVMPIKQTDAIDIVEDMLCIENDINTAFKKLENKHERNQKIL